MWPGRMVLGGKDMRANEKAGRRKCVRVCVEGSVRQGGPAVSRLYQTKRSHNSREYQDVQRTKSDFVPSRRCQVTVSLLKVGQSYW